MSSRWDCTLFQYIGELCRYLVASPPHPLERRHRIRLCCGSGLSADVWPRFQERFAIPRILEFYAATEGIVSLYNCEGKPGAIGRVPPFLAHRSGLALVKLDAERRAAARRRRTAASAAPRTRSARPWAVSARMAAASKAIASDAASERKILRDVFAAGDRWFRTGDLMRRDEAGYFYFVDRIGDTFRWKGENVSTTEVAAAISACPGIVDAAVYGVRVPGAEGRAGMAAIVAAPGFDLARIAAALGRHTCPTMRGPCSCAFVPRSKPRRRSGR